MAHRNQRRDASCCPEIFATSAVGALALGMMACAALDDGPLAVVQPDAGRVVYAYVDARGWSADLSGSMATLAKLQRSLVEASSSLREDADLDAGTEWTVRLGMTIDEGGLVGNVEVVESSGHGGVDEAARQAGRSVRTAPPPAQGSDIPRRIEAPLVFRVEALDDQSKRTEQVESHEDGSESSTVYMCRRRVQGTDGGAAPAAVVEPYVVLLDGVRIDGILDSFDILDSMPIEAIDIYKGKEAVERFGSETAGGVLVVATEYGGGAVGVRSRQGRR